MMILLHIICLVFSSICIAMGWFMRIEWRIIVVFMGNLGILLLSSILCATILYYIITTIFIYYYVFLTIIA
jgi:hypothetical protein